MSFNDNADTTRVTTRHTTTTTGPSLLSTPTLLTSPPSTPVLVFATIATLSGSSRTGHLFRNIPWGRVRNIWTGLTEISSNSFLMDHISLFNQKLQIPTNFTVRETNTDSQMFGEKIARPSQNILIKITFTTDHWIILTTTTWEILPLSTEKSPIRTQSHQ